MKINKLLLTIAAICFVPLALGAQGWHVDIPIVKEAPNKRILNEDWPGHHYNDIVLAPSSHKSVMNMYIDNLPMSDKGVNTMLAYKGDLSNIYSIKGDVKCALPITETEYGYFTNYHALRPFIERGDKYVNVENEYGVQKRLEILSYYYKPRGLDYVWLTDGKMGEGEKVEASNTLEKGDWAYYWSPMHKWQQGKVETVPDTRYDPYKYYIDFGACGSSGSLVFNKDGKAVGMFSAKTGDPRNPVGAVLRLDEVIKHAKTFQNKVEE